MLVVWGLGFIVQRLWCLHSAGFSNFCESFSTPAHILVSGMMALVRLLFILPRCGIAGAGIYFSAAFCGALCCQLEQLLITIEFVGFRFSVLICFSGACSPLISYVMSHIYAVLLAAAIFLSNLWLALSASRLTPSPSAFHLSFLLPVRRCSVGSPFALRIQVGVLLVLSFPASASLTVSLFCAALHGNFCLAFPGVTFSPCGGPSVLQELSL